MHPAYEDIIEAAKPKDPLWYTAEGVPRFAPFNHAMTEIYDKYVVYYRIACQHCEQEFSVAQGWTSIDKKPCFSKNLQNLHFGDPPNHGCTGDTMNCDDIEVLEFWRQGKDYEWKRDRRLEVPLSDYDRYRGK